MAQWIILAGRRRGGDPVADAAGEPFKALVKVAGVPMLARVLRTIRLADPACRVTILLQDPAVFTGRADWAWLTGDPHIRLAASKGSISQSLNQMLEEKTAAWPVLVTTADNALLSPATARLALAATATPGSDLEVAFVPARLVHARYPGARRTFWRFADGGYSTCNLFVLRNPNVLKALDFWAEVEEDRKKVWRIVKRFGLPILALYSLRLVSLARGLAWGARRLGLSARPLILDDPDACIDVDKPADLLLSERILLARGHG
ncbi:MAG: NTP transferase domain-containing protein [Pseudomonadota bacterium]